MDTKEVLQRLREKRIDAEFTNQLLVDLEDQIGVCEKQIQLMEDAVMVYHIQRAPTRRAWYVSVGNCRGDRAKAIVQDFKKDMSDLLKMDDRYTSRHDNVFMREEVFFPRYTEENNNSCIEDSDIQTTWDGGALLETLYGKRERLLFQYSRLYTAIETNVLADIMKIICEIPSWRMR